MIHISAASSKQKMTMVCDSTSQSEWHDFDCDGHRLTLPIRYQDPVPIGQGTFGAVM